MFVLGAATGYVVGTRTGRQGYERLKRQASALWTAPSVQKTVTQAEEFARDKIPVVGATVSAAAKKAGEAVTDAAEKNGSPASTDPIEQPAEPEEPTSGSDQDNSNNG
ncbi:MAG: hypothetical protein JWQ43_2898 [Glaciihabitans sp.]|nr:hypothetical protein [Glaciihabitans sp.]